jgi:hypothetical protein
MVRSRHFGVADWEYDDDMVEASRCRPSRLGELHLPSLPMPGTFSRFSENIPTEPACGGTRRGFPGSPVNVPSLGWDA